MAAVVCSSGDKLERVSLRNGRGCARARYTASRSRVTCALTGNEAVELSRQAELQGGSVLGHLRHDPRHERNR